MQQRTFRKFGNWKSKTALRKGGDTKKKNQKQSPKASIGREHIVEGKGDKRAAANGLNIGYRRKTCIGKSCTKKDCH